MKLHRILAILEQEVHLTRHSFEIMVDFFFFTFINIIVFGFISTWLAGSNKLNAQYLITGMIFWNIVSITAFSIAGGSLWDIWSRNLANLFVAPLTMTEYLLAHMLSAFIKALILFVMTVSIAIFFFQFNPFILGMPNIILYFISLTLFGWTLGFFVVGIIFRFGTRIQALAWSIASIFQPLTAAFYPVKILPPFLQTVAYLLPPTYIFEAARKNLSTPGIQWDLIGASYLINIIYLLASIIFFKYLYNKSKESGQFAKNEG